MKNHELEAEALRKASGIAPAQSLDAEMAVLGCLLLDTEAHLDLPSGFHEDCFYRTEHKVAFRAAMLLVAANKPVDLLSLSEQLRTTDELEQAGGPAYLAGLLDSVASSKNLPHYADILLGHLQRRRMALACSMGMALAQDPAMAIKDSVARVEHELAGFTESRIKPVTALESARAILKDIEHVMGGGSDARAFLTGIPALDEVLFINPTDSIVIGARPRDGKSMLLWQICRHVAEHYGPTAFGNFEMGHKELAARALTDFANLTIRDVRNPRPEHAERLAMAVEKYGSLPITIMPSNNLSDFLREARRLVRKGLKLLCLDYLQIVRLSAEHGETRDQRIGFMTQAIKQFCADEGVPCIAAAQLKRIEHLKHGRDPRPTLEDLRESGNIEQDANTVLFIYRPGEVSGTAEAKAGDFKTTELLLAKQRSGPSWAKVIVHSEFEHARFIPAPEPEPGSDENERDAP